MVCKICSSLSESAFKTLILQKYQVTYYKCIKCKFIQTESPFWLEEAYQSAITDLDIGLVFRNVSYSGVVGDILLKFFNPNDKFLDYGGGYGMFVRLMRDAGFDFYRYDIYCENLFSKYFDYTDLPEGQKFEALTAFELFEHLVNPLEEIEKMFALSDSIIFSTELQPNNNVNPDNWWYFVPETGQHIALYSKESLQEVADLFNVSLSSMGNLHVLTKEKKVDFNKYNQTKITLESRFKNKIISLLGERPKEIRASLLQADFNYVKSKLKK